MSEDNEARTNWVTWVIFAAHGGLGQWIFVYGEFNRLSIIIVFLIKIYYQGNIWTENG